VTSKLRNLPEFLMGLGIVACGLVIGWQASTIKVAPIYAKVGPAAFLWIAAGLLVACGAIVAFRARKSSVEEEGEVGGPLAIMAGLGLSIFLLERIGFILSSALIFVLTARGLGSRKPLRDAIIGLILCIIAYLVFAKGLGLRLPTAGLHP
jgi:putative tricarboxylic transport membrane protein